MTDIVEQAARVAYETYHKAGEFRPYEIAQALADAGLLREPVTTILEEFVVPCAKCNPDEGRCLPCREEADTYYRAAINAISTYSAAKELARDGDSDAGGYVGRDLRKLAERIKQHLLEHPEPPARTVPTRDVYELATERITAESTWTVDAREALGLTRTVPNRATADPEEIADEHKFEAVGDFEDPTAFCAKCGEWFNGWEYAKHVADVAAVETRTVPTRERIALRVREIVVKDYDFEMEKSLHIADAVRALLADQPTVAEVKAQTL